MVSNQKAALYCVNYCFFSDLQVVWRPIVGVFTCPGMAPEGAFVFYLPSSKGMRVLLAIRFQALMLVATMISWAR